MGDIIGTLTAELPLDKLLGMSEKAAADIRLLICPDCGADELREVTDRLVCGSCGKSYRMESGKIFFTEQYFDVENWEGKSAGFDLLKRVRSSHIRVDKIGGPRIGDLPSFLKIRPDVVLNLGSGKDNYPGHTNIDLGRYPNVHIVCSLERIPYKDCSVDLLVSNSVLEHIYDVEAVVREIHRVLKPGGYLYLCVPSLCTRHHEIDYHRWTMPGLLRLLRNFEIIEKGGCRDVAYVLVNLIESLIVAKTRPGLFREAARKLWLLASVPLFWLKGDNSDEFIAMSQTIYVIARKATA